jgi:conjugal transfer mating pair stabilization protein TraG
MREASQSISSAITRQHTISEATADTARWQQAFSRRDYSSLNIDSSTGESIRRGFETSMRDSERDHSGVGLSSMRSNSNNTSATVGGGASLKIGAGGIGIGVDAGASTNTSALDQLSRTHSSGRDNSVEQSKALSRALNEELSRRSSTGSGNSSDRVLSKSLETQRNFQDLVSASGTSTDQTGQALRESSSFIASSQRIGAVEIADQVATNRDYAMYQLLSGRDFGAMPETQQFQDIAERDMDSGATDRLQGNPAARQAAVRHRAAVLMSQNEQVAPAARMAALEYLTGSAMAMQHLGFRPFQSQMHELKIGAPSNASGVNRQGLMSRGDGVERAGVPGANVTRPQTSFGTQPNFEAEAGGLRSVDASGADVRAEMERQDLIAGKADLGDDGSGTAKRTLKNVAGNVGTAFGKAGSPSRVGVGRPGSAEGPDRTGLPPDAADPAAPAAGSPEGENRRDR